MGILFLCALSLIFLALMSWSVNDPSLSYASDSPVSNWLGFPGAVIADIGFQFFGLGILALMIPPVLWSMKMIKRNLPSHMALRSLLWLIASALICGMLAFFNAPETWPLPSGLGGIIGLGFAGLAGFVAGDLVVQQAGWLFALILFTPAAVSFWLAVRTLDPFAMHVPKTPKQKDTPKSVSMAILSAIGNLGAITLGAITHSIFSASIALKKARMRQQEKRAQQNDSRENIEPVLDSGHAQQPQPTPARAPRIEPHFTNDMARTAQSHVEGNATADFADDYIDYPDFDDEPVEPQIAQPQAPQAPVTKPRVAAPAPRPAPGRRVTEEAQASLLQDDGFELPELSYLTDVPNTATAKEHMPETLEENARRLEGVLEDFGVKGDIINVRPGPVVTLYELEPAPGIKSSRVIGLADDIARSMSAISARVAVVPGRNAIGIELPNETRETVYLRELLASQDFEKVKGKLPLCLGKTIGGESIIADLARMPHLLIAGTTGSGKSVAVNTFILSLLYRWTPEQCRLIMIDPKMLELSIYDGIPHLLTPVVTDPAKAVTALKWAVREMEDRYKKMSKVGVRNIDGFNQRVAEAKKKGEVITRTVQTGFDRETGEAIFESEEFDLEPLPFIVVIVDEMADLMMVAGKDIEGAIQRLAQMARAAGIHLIMATQRPSVDVITGTIKANFPTRISFQVTSKIDSRTILGEQGAEQLLGMGDMLYMAGGGRTRRLHGPFVSDGEVEAVVQHLKSQGTPEYLDNVTEEVEEDGVGNSNLGNSGDELYDKAVNIVLSDRKASTSYIQRRLSIGYNRAATLIERMEEEGVISPANHAGKREVLVGDEESAL
ncbi:DNA translocase FtsK 4TM domain-containing protein [Maritalea sp. P4.10X]|uniref:DNA translocase FtsK n=1 Tax=Maritalea mediterranea TaxID=2909667 RepID=A0ABS9E653_9HYPH|nr:DNA translocase FtsK 4TM domain-containing protein [Maritalea mediterranea]MCF4096903.1 DNA translocase FtsK 4TM domain-containing protein [Maritalea mediterranea]